jgi:biotin carboxyl carrier protein
VKYFVMLGGREVEIEVDGDQVSVAGHTVRATLSMIPGSPVRHLLIDGRSYALPIEAAGPGRWAVTAHGERRELEVVDARTRHIRSLTGPGDRKAGPGVLRAPMPGLVVRIQVEAGQAVAAGSPMIVLEAMKMENQLKAAAAVTVAAIRVTAGQAVEKGQILVEFAEP